MPAIKLPEVVPRMLQAAKGPLAKGGADARAYATSEFKKIGETLLFIEREVGSGRMTPERARLHLEMQKNAAKMVLLTLEGLGILAVEAAINGALSVVKDAVNTSLGIELI